MSQMQLLGQRKFWPLFWVSFLTAFNDNVFKQALIVFVTMKSLEFFGLGADVLTALATILIIIPFVILSATAGQVLDRAPKASVIRKVKIAELLIMGLGCYGMITEDIGILLLVLFLTGVQSTFFGPAKYSMLPEILEDHELVGGNAMIEMATFVSVLTGTILGGLLMGGFGLKDGPIAVSVAIMIIALLGIATSYLVQHTPPANPDLKIDLNPITPNISIMKETARDRDVFLCIMGLSWFWFLGAAVLSAVPAYATRLFAGNEMGVTYLVAVFSIGTGIGSLLCERFSRHGVELGLVPFGSIGMSVFLIDLFFVGMPALGSGAPITIMEMVTTFAGARISFDLFMVALFGGVFTVPLYTLIQVRTEAHRRSRVIAGLGIISSLFIFAAGALATVMLAQKIAIPYIYLAVGVMNIVVAAFIYKLLPVFLWRFLVLLVTHIAYRFDARGHEHIPKEGRGVVVCNHPSFIDFTFAAIAIPRPARFIMHYSYFQKPAWRWLFEETRVIPIAGRSEDPQILEDAFDQIAEALENDELVCIFPEGKVSRDGKLGAFRPGIEKIIARTPAPVIPMALEGMWGSFFSYEGGKPMSRPFKRFRARIDIEIGAPVPAEEVSAHALAERIARMGGWDVPERIYSSSEEEE